MKVETIAQNWQSFAKAAVPKDAGPAQRKAMEQAFFGGVLSMFGIMVSQLSKIPVEADALAATAVIYNEIVDRMSELCGEDLGERLRTMALDEEKVELGGPNG